MKRTEASWQTADGRSTEYLVLRETADAILVTSEITSNPAGSPPAVRYDIECDSAWRTRRVAVNVDRPDRRIELLGDGEGHWSSSGRALESLKGAIDVDLVATPFTNTLPIRRLGLRMGETREILVAYVDVPSLIVDRRAQRYTRLADHRYRFRSLDDGFERDIAVDDDGLVVDYPGLFRRVR